MDYSMKLCEWEEIHGFSSLHEYECFVKYIEQQVVLSLVEEMLVNQEYEKGKIYEGRWFKHIESSQIWRLVPPDFPFTGLFEPVEER